MDAVTFLQVYGHQIAYYLLGTGHTRLADIVQFVASLAQFVH